MGIVTTIILQGNGVRYHYNVAVQWGHQPLCSCRDMEFEATIILLGNDVSDPSIIEDKSSI